MVRSLLDMNENNSFLDYISYFLLTFTWQSKFIPSTLFEKRTKEEYSGLWMICNYKIWFHELDNFIFYDHGIRNENDSWNFRQEELKLYKALGEF